MVSSINNNLDDVLQGVGGFVSLGGKFPIVKKSKKWSQNDIGKENMPVARKVDTETE